MCDSVPNTLVLDDKSKIWYFTNKSNDRPRLLETISAPSNICEISTEGSYILALTKLGEVYRLERLSHSGPYQGEFILGGKTERNIWKKIPIPEKLVHVAAGYNLALGLTSTGKVYSWSPSLETHLNLPDLLLENQNLQNFSKNIPIKEVALAYNNLHILSKKGKVYNWGTNFFASKKELPLPIDNLTNIIQLKGDNYYCLALSASGEVYSWIRDSGFSTYDSLNFNSWSKPELPWSKPKKITPLPPIRAITIGMGIDLALTKEGEVYVWGRNGFGQLGINSQVDPIEKPCLYPSPTKSLIRLYFSPRTKLVTGPPSYLAIEKSCFARETQL